MVLPETLPVGQGNLLELPVSVNQNDRRAGLERDPSLDPEYGVADVNTKADPVTSTDLAQPVDQVNTLQHLAANRDGDALLEAELQELAASHLLGGDRLLKNLARDLAGGIVRHSTANGRPPEPRVDRVLANARIDIDPSLLEKIIFLLAAQLLIPRRGDNFDSRQKHVEGCVEADLVIAGPRGAMGDGIRARLCHLAGNHLGLHHALGSHRQGIDLAAKNIALHQVADPALKNLPTRIDGVMLDSAESARALLYFGELGGIKTAGIDRNSHDLKTLLLTQVGNAIGGIKSPGVCENDFPGLVHMIIRDPSESAPAAR